MKNKFLTFVLLTALVTVFANQVIADDECGVFGCGLSKSDKQAKQENSRNYDRPSTEQNSNQISSSQDRTGKEQLLGSGL